MKLKKCRDCGKMISRTAEVCPNCGRVRGFFDTMKDFAVFLVVLIFAIIVTLALFLWYAKTHPGF